jgi:hypothetical protein
MAPTNRTPARGRGRRSRTLFAFASSSTDNTPLADHQPYAVISRFGLTSLRATLIVGRDR